MEAQENVNLPELWQMWVGGVPTRDIAAHFGVSLQRVYHLKRKHKLPVRSSVCDPKVADPTPEEIRTRAREVRRRHFAERRGETAECSRIKTWRNA